VSNFLIQVNIVSFPADKVLCRKRAGCEPASGAEEHSPVMFNQGPTAFFATTGIIAPSKFRHGRTLIIFPVLRNRDYSNTIIPETVPA
jgi:hypothetical protein